MTRRTATVTLQGGELRFVGRAGSGHDIVLDSGTGDAGMRPAELLPLALAGCTAMDVISILRKKRQDSAGTPSRRPARRRPITRTPSPGSTSSTWSRDRASIARRSSRIELSATKYCSVGATLASGDIEIHHGYVVRDDDLDTAHSAEVIVLGPGASTRDPAELVGVG